MAVRGIPRSFVRRRMERAFLLILACYIGLVGRLLFLQGAQGGALRARATKIREETISLKAHRGTIYDREGRPLAVSLYSGTVGFDPFVVLPDPKDPKKTAKTEQQLAAALPKVAAILRIPEAALAEQVRQARARYTPQHHERFIKIAKDVSLEAAQQIRDSHPRLIGFGVEDGSKRVYSSDRDAASIVGFVSADQIGLAGLERSCRAWLAGNPGYAVAEVDDHKREIPDTLQRMVPARDGLDLHTTLDTNAQHIAMEEAQKVYDQFHPNGIAVVIVDPINGDVLAMVSLPTFSPNPGQFETAPPDTRRERCACQLYEPGSTLKALTISAALDHGDISLDSHFFCGGTLQVGNKVIHCVLEGAAQRNGHGVETPIDILRHSCNVGAAQIGMKMGPKALYTYDARFGLFDPLHIGLPGETHGRLSFDKNEKIYTDAKVARVAFGHSITTTPLNVAMAYAAIANGGILMKPRLILSTTDSNGKVVQKWQPQSVRRVISTKTSAEVCEMLRAVVSDGTGKVAAIPGYTIGGKTGTAQKYRRGAYIGSFIGVLPCDPKVKPRAVILVAVDEPHGAYYGAEVAAPCFHQIASRLAACWRIPEDDPDADQARIAAENMRKEGTPVIITAKTH
ncbi:MAG TPA: penicillin-binding protein 2 [Chthonomonadaceae bacterium]|nr:penicillin-binding protein 2 [Chthonomonadaceae bacterium]